MKNKKRDAEKPDHPYRPWDDDENEDDMLLFLQKEYIEMLLRRMNN